MTNILENKTLQKVAGVLAAVGAINWGLTKFVNIDLLSYVPEGIFTTAVVIAITVSGVVIGYMVIKKKI